MKKVIALCLALVLVLSIAGLCLAGGVHCNHCGKNNATIVYTGGSCTYQNIYFHHTLVYRQIYCPDCHSVNTETVYDGPEEHTCPTHYHQLLTPHLSYEYDICGICGGAYNSYTRVIN